MVTAIPLFGPIPGGPELLIILLVLVLLFGANKIPKLARSTGEAMGEFKKGREEVEEELQEMREGSTEEESSTSAESTTEESSTSESESESEEETEEATEK
ncbi:MAG: twin-arginine translocase TatA/TatE family subunit [Halopenitus sp.]